MTTIFKSFVGQLSQVSWPKNFKSAPIEPYDDILIHQIGLGFIDYLSQQQKGTQQSWRTIC